MDTHTHTHAATTAPTTTGRAPSTSPAAPIIAAPVTMLLTQDQAGASPRRACRQPVYCLGAAQRAQQDQGARVHLLDRHRAGRGVRLPRLEEADIFEDEVVFEAAEANAHGHPG